MYVRALPKSDIDIGLPYPIIGTDSDKCVSDCDTHVLHVSGAALLVEGGGMQSVRIVYIVVDRLRV